MILNLSNKNDHLNIKEDIKISENSFFVSENVSRQYFTTLYKDNIYISDNPNELALFTNATFDKTGIFLFALTGSCFNLTSPFKNIYSLKNGIKVIRNNLRLVFRKGFSTKTTNTLSIDEAVSIFTSRLSNNKDTNYIPAIDSPEYNAYIELNPGIKSLEINLDETNIDYEFFDRLSAFPIINTSILDLLLIPNDKIKYSTILCGCKDLFSSYKWAITNDRDLTENIIKKSSPIPFEILNRIFEPKVIRDGLSIVRNYIDISSHRKLIEYIFNSKVKPFNNLFNNDKRPFLPFIKDDIKNIVKSLPESVINNNKVDYYPFRCIIDSNNKKRNSILNSHDLHIRFIKKNREILEFMLKELSIKSLGEDTNFKYLNEIELFNTFLFYNYLKRSSIDISIK